MPKINQTYDANPKTEPADGWGNIPGSGDLQNPRAEDREYFKSIYNQKNPADEVRAELEDKPDSGTNPAPLNHGPAGFSMAFGERSPAGRVKEISVAPPANGLTPRGLTPLGKDIAQVNGLRANDFQMPGAGDREHLKSIYNQKNPADEVLAELEDKPDSGTNSAPLNHGPAGFSMTLGERSPAGRVKETSVAPPANGLTSRGLTPLGKDIAQGNGLRANDFQMPGAGDREYFKSIYNQKNPADEVRAELEDKPDSGTDPAPLNHGSAGFSRALGEGPPAGRVKETSVAPPANGLTPLGKDMAQGNGLRADDIQKPGTGEREYFKSIYNQKNPDDEVRAELEDKPDSGTDPAPLSNLSAMLSNVLGGGPAAVRGEDKVVTPPASEFSPELNEVVSRILVSDPVLSGQEEVRLMIDDGILKSTEIRLTREAGGHLSVLLLTNDAASFQTLVAARSDLKEALEQGEQSEISLTVADSGAEDNAADRRSRGYRGYSDE